MKNKIKNHLTHPKELFLKTFLLEKRKNITKRPQLKPTIDIKIIGKPNIVLHYPTTFLRRNFL
ncbi:hypothetical protein GvMRE_IIg493 [endosymbiont GvMRE of Glomus versiforme]|nr:hypothetical protein GvMRE_IIg493 [endosymbiont GvMRE of Glomus versiforme]